MMDISVKFAPPTTSVLSAPPAAGADEDAAVEEELEENAFPEPPPQAASSRPAAPAPASSTKRRGAVRDEVREVFADMSGRLLCPLPLSAGVSGGLLPQGLGRRPVRRAPLLPADLSQPKGTPRHIPTSDHDRITIVAATAGPGAAGSPGAAGEPSVPPP